MIILASLTLALLVASYGWAVAWLGNVARAHGWTFQ